MSGLPTSFDPEAIFATLNRHGVDYVVVGGIAATLHGSSVRTGDSDICPARDAANLDRLAAALTELEAAIRTSAELVELPVSGPLPASAAIWNLSTTFGGLDIAFEPSGTEGFDDLL